MTDEPKKIGRPRTEMTDEKIEVILRAVRLGLHPERAAQAAGVTLGSFRMHKKRNPAFVMAIKEAEAGAESTFLGRIFTHMDRHWQSIAWMLERRWPERWSKREHVEVSTKGEAEQLLSDLAAIRTRNAKGPDAAKPVD